MVRLFLSLVITLVVLPLVTRSQSSTGDLCPKNCTCGVPANADAFRPRAQEREVNCVGRGFTEIPYWDIPCDARIIDFSDNNLTRLTRSSFRGLQQLEYIALKNNHISYMETATFAGLPNLKDVILVQNDFTEIDERPFWDAEFGNIILQVDDNPFFCNFQLKRTYLQIESKVSMSGIFCETGERKRPFIIKRRRTQIPDNYLIDVIDIIRMRLYSYQIASIAGACWAFVWMCIVGLYFLWTYDEGRYRKQYGRYFSRAKKEAHKQAKRLNQQRNGELEFELDPEYDEYEMAEYHDHGTAPHDGYYYDDRARHQDSARFGPPRDEYLDEPVGRGVTPYDDDPPRPQSAGRRDNIGARYHPQHQDSVREDSYYPNSMPPSDMGAARPYSPPRHDAGRNSPGQNHDEEFDI